MAQRRSFLKNPISMIATRGSSKKVFLEEDPLHFQGPGVDIKAKFIGDRMVDGPRGEVMCNEAMRLAKARVKELGVHKQKITLNVSIEGIKIVDEKSGTLFLNFPVTKISYIARDPSDARAFGFIYGVDGHFKFYGIKTALSADHAVQIIHDMFQVVYEMKKSQIEELTQQMQKEASLSGCRFENGVLVADIVDLHSPPKMPDSPTSLIHISPDSAATTTISDGRSASNHVQMLPNTSVFPFHKAGNKVAFVGIDDKKDYGWLSQFNNDLEEAFSKLAAEKLPPTPYPLQTPNLETQENIVEFDWPPTVAAPSAPTGPIVDIACHATGVEDTNHLHEPGCVTTLEEAFTKLVDLDSLGSKRNMGEGRKNPFDRILNPPQKPMNALKNQDISA